MSSWQSIPKPYLILYLALSALLNVLGLASLVEGVVTWAGFLAEVINVYHQFLRDPILRAVMYFWPAAWPKVPSWAIDLFIIQSSFFISYRLFMAFEKEKYLITFKEVQILQPVLVFLGGPFVPFFQLIRLRAKAKLEIKQAEIEAEEGEAAELQYSRYGDTNLPLLSPEGWLALDKRQIAGLQAIEAAKSTFLKLNLYYCCYLIMVIILLFVGYQIGHIKI
jgi:hypothetical protein